ncbi:MAG: threonine/serine exporter family protein [Schaedlerella sp.]|uniref:threonine/serine exporter family protein n=1 Tax=Schaedlerella sp. TaxID=2676057 RepID=UPI0026382C24|nr:threonine/serine exporter family protein [uncultured Schaedlerella sp.]
MEEKRLTRSETAAVMDFTATLGEAVLIRGGELWRVEEVINSIFCTYGLKDGGIFMLPHTLIISARSEGMEPVIRQKNVGEIIVDMEELSGLTTLIHRIHQEKPAPEKLMGMLGNAAKGDCYPAILKICGMAIALLSLNYLIGGNLMDAVFIGVGIVLVMGLDMYLSVIPGTRKMAVSAAGAWLAGMIDVIGCRMGVLPDPYHVMVVTALGLVPGIPLINSFREMLCGRVLCDPALPDGDGQQAALYAGGGAAWSLVRRAAGAL